MEKPLKVLISAYACGPNWGSEIGMGWNWVISLSEHCKLTVITELDFKKDIEEKLPSMNLRHTPDFHYIDIGTKARRLFWKQGSFLFYYYYRKWQKNAYNLALKLIEKEEFTIVHQLNMIGYREPGYLWKIKNIPFIWGPVGGHNQVPFSFMLSMSLKNSLFYLAKGCINFLQFLLLRRPKKAAKRSSVVLAATRESAEAISKTTTNKVVVLNETGCEVSAYTLPEKRHEGLLRMIWIGRIQGLKALPLALKVISKLGDGIQVHLTIIGDGPDESKNRMLVEKLNIQDSVNWLGRIPNKEVIEHLRNSDLLFFTSLKEGTPHVVMESLQNGVPVLCHDACGHGAVINETCGVKVEQKNEANSIEKFTAEIISLYHNRSRLHELAEGAIEKSKELSWSCKAEKMVKYYHEIIANNER